MPVEGRLGLSIGFIWCRRILIESVNRGHNGYRGVETASIIFGEGVSGPDGSATEEGVFYQRVIGHLRR